MMNMQTILAAAQAVEQEVTDSTTNISFNPENFITNLKYMGIGMLVIFVIIGLIALSTMLINKVFQEK